MRADAFFGKCFVVHLGLDAKGREVIDLRYARWYTTGHCYATPGMRQVSPTTTNITATELTSFDVDPAGMYVRLHMRDAEGKVHMLVIPTDGLQTLMMTLPDMVRRALRNRYRDESLRLVHSLEDFKVELGEPGADGIRQFILTLATQGGFEVAFSATQESLDSLSGAIAADTLSHEAETHHARRFS